MKFNEPKYGIVQDVRKGLIYFLIKNEEVVYVGQTHNGFYRVYEHTDKDYDIAYYIDYDVDDLDKVEGEYIIKYQPKYNKMLNNSYIKLHGIRQRLNRTIRSVYEEAGLRYKYITSKKVMQLLQHEKIKIHEYELESYVYFEDFAIIDANIINFVKGAPIDEIYNFRI